MLLLWMMRIFVVALSFESGKSRISKGVLAAIILGAIASGIATWPLIIVLIMDQGVSRTRAFELISLMITAWFNLLCFMVILDLQRKNVELEEDNNILKLKLQTKEIQTEMVQERLTELWCITIITAAFNSLTHTSNMSSIVQVELQYHHEYDEISAAIGMNANLFENHALLVFPTHAISGCSQQKTGASCEDFISYVSKWCDDGASLVGGCCRTTNIIRAIHRMLLTNLLFLAVITNRIESTSLTNFGEFRGHY
ncbi:hypothetical protein ACFE04_025885 [Oxalis oulophora]